MPSLQGKNKLYLKYAYHHSCLVSDSTILLSLYHSTHVSSLQYKNAFTTQDCAWEGQRQISSLLYPLDRGINLHVEDPEPTNIDNESTHSSNATVALGGPEAEGHPAGPAYSNHNKLRTLTREINDLHQ